MYLILNWMDLSQGRLAFVQMKVKLMHQSLSHTLLLLLVNLFVLLTSSQASMTSKFQPVTSLVSN